MSSILERTDLNRIYLIYGHLDDMFISGNLQVNNFRPFLNGYLKSLGYEQIVFYSGAKNVGKFVMDDESAMLAINKNKRIMSENQQVYRDDARDTYTALRQADTMVSVPKRKRRILNPRVRGTANAGVEAQKEQITYSSAEVQTEVYPSGRENNSRENTAESVSTDKRRKLIYKQPKITPIEFLEDAKKIMADTTHKSAIVFTFFQDFVTDRTAPLQPYLELVSHLWDEYSSNSNENICIFLAPQMSTKDLSDMFDNMENGYVLKNRFFNADGTANRGTTIEVGLPNDDEVGYLLEYLRIVGDKGKRITFRQSGKKRIVSSILYYSREKDKSENRSGFLNAVYNDLVYYMRRSDTAIVNIDDEAVTKIYGSDKKQEMASPLEQLKNTRGWESVAERINEIIRDYHIKKEEYEKKYAKQSSLEKHQNHAYSNERIDKENGKEGFLYQVPHFIIRGNPGVGKTTVARLIGKIFYDEGMLRKGDTIEAKRDDLVDAYVGGTAIRTTECVERATEGVLFIDDAYSLLEKGEEHNFAKEAIDTLVPIMTNPDRYRFCMIMAGYPELMDELLAMNPGLKSRFSNANILTIEDYPPDLLKDIFIKECHKDGYRLSQEMDLALFFNNLYGQRNRADFGNARDIVAIAKEVKLQCSLRDNTTRCIIREDFGDYQKYFIRQGVSSIDEIYAKLDTYVGMEFVKDLFKSVRFELLDVMDSKSRGIKPETYPEHYIFAGNPGTGKTTVGKMIGEFYHIMGVLGAAQTLFADASDIIGNHVGDSKDKVTALMQRAIDHNQVLYIDEAYQISESAYGNEIIGAMMTKMTENADDFRVIFGMYTNKVENFLKLNAGLSRRLRIVEFPDYTPEQLTEIFDRTIEAAGCTITQEAHERVAQIFKYLYSVRGEDFGNAGEVKKLAADMKRRRLERVYSSALEGEEKYRYELSDIPQKLLELTKAQAGEKSFEDIMKELKDQIGMSDLKDIVLQKQEEILYAKKSGESTEDICPGYYFFVGNPGTGKSTSAQLFANCLYRLGIVKTDKFYSCTAKDLIGQYVGETDKKTYELLQKSVNSVLFIDEAYSLSYSDGYSDGGFKKEALEQMIAFMDQSEHRKNCCIVFAGYEKDMQGLYKSNSGMRSRIEEVHFRDYSAEELYEIFKLFCQKNGFQVSEGVEKVYIPIFAKLKELTYFSNGRTARTIYEKTIINMKRRIVRSDDIPKGGERLVIEEDLLSEEDAVRIIGADGN